MNQAYRPSPTFIVEDGTQQITQTASVLIPKCSMYGIFTKIKTWKSHKWSLSDTSLNMKCWMADGNKSQEPFGRQGWPWGPRKPIAAHTDFWYYWWSTAMKNGLLSIIVPFPTEKNNIDTNSKPDNWCLHTYISSVSLIHFICYKLQPYIHGHQLTWKLNWGSFEKTIWLYIWRYWIHNDSHSIWILMK